MSIHPGGKAVVPVSGWEDAEQILGTLADDSLLRRLRTVSRVDNQRIFFDDRELINFCSNNYLGLAQHPRVTAAAAEAAGRWGAGAGASRLICGNLSLHEELEVALAQFKQAETALTFSSGYLANLGLVQALGARADGSRVPVLFDRLSHASIVDAAAANGRGWKSFRHNDPGSLEDKLRKLTAKPRAVSGFSALVFTEGVFSMDGDIAPLPELLSVCEKSNACLIVDDAHGTGTVGPRGRGTAALSGVSRHPLLVQMGTLSKALGSQGGFVCGPAVLRGLLVNRARSFIYDTALAPAAAAAALESLQIIGAEPGRIGRLEQNITQLSGALFPAVPSVATPIVPVIVGDPAKTVSTAEKIVDSGFLVLPIRPPTVPRGTSRLRITLTSEHTPQQIAALADALNRAQTTQPLT